jgi:transcriptional regulator with XRE-family HTH domain
MDKELAESIGAASREARKALELTQEDAAERIGVSAEFYARIERGNALPSVPTFARIVMALGVSADTLLGFREDEESEERATPGWGKPEPPSDAPEIRRLMRRLRRASPGTLRLVALLLKELERANPNGTGGDENA